MMFRSDKAEGRIGSSLLGRVVEMEKENRKLKYANRRLLEDKLDSEQY